VCNVAATAAVPVEVIADRSEARLRLRRHVKADLLRPGVIVQQHDWSLHVRKVDVQPGSCRGHGHRVEVELRCVADQQVRLAA
jgi:hypothetical protein